MNCPECGMPAIVRNSRQHNGEVLRERVCKSCGSKFYTFESMDDTGYAEKIMKRIHADMNSEYRRRRNAQKAQKA